jgi:GNAT superfamily N-acetyltransferase
MPRLNDLTIVRTLLDHDRHWSAYAIGDLSPELVDHCDWHVPANASTAPALLLLYRGFTPPILFAMGEPADLIPLFHELHAPEVSLHLRPQAVDALDGIYAPAETRRMRRMMLRAEKFTPASHEDVTVVGEEHLAAIASLYEHGHRRGEGPTFFHAAMLQQHTFRGIWEDGALVAVAGTHLYSRNLGVCALGNVYTRSDRRGRGLGARVTSAVAAYALAEGVTTIVLNVGHANRAAERVYQRLGFGVYCEFFEGEATRVQD